MARDKASIDMTCSDQLNVTTRKKIETPTVKSEERSQTEIAEIHSLEDIPLERAALAPQQWTTAALNFFPFRFLE
ncbi:unnamed protein product [Nezara viridula]|uniref:Uncharacterized protein n=1 Tax=Nezara viridula TaxID=85310 RepID=A0A9P0EA70_NEZVI|nr:unnamed protein product [Nezara viridula]